MTTMVKHAAENAVHEERCRRTAVDIEQVRRHLSDIAEIAEDLGDDERRAVLRALSKLAPAIDRIAARCQPIPEADDVHVNGRLVAVAGGA